MDDPSLSAEEHAHALKGLARVHRLTGTSSRLWKCIRQHRNEARKFVVMDVGCGDGLLLLQLYSLASNEGIELELHACDFSQRAIEMAQEAANSKGIRLSTHQVDITQDALPVRADLVICSLFLHHFEDQQVIGILKKLRAAAGHLLLVEDLLRSKLGYLLCWIGVHALTRSRIVHVDGLLSVRAGFTKPEISQLAQESGLAGRRIETHWPERFLLSWSPAGLRQ
jgi:2-polyprenyl-3-methyl-5-hydroxy-6-metoxy-1,4-benzoquinol methylase